jgi:hypothetical protein
MERAWGRRQELLNPPAPELPAEAVSGLDRLVGSYNQSYEAAKAANEARYQQMLGITAQTTGQRAADIRSSYAGQSADIMQQLARQGMAGTTVAPTMKFGVEREKQAALDRLADQMQQTKLGIIERRTDAYPDYGSLSKTLESIGSGYGASGTTAMINALSRVRQS